MQPVEPVLRRDPPRLRLLSFNIQVGLRSSHYGHYVTNAWRHALPGTHMHATLDRMAELMQGYDFVAVQEADAGSLRTRFVNQIEYLAERAGFNHCGLTITRDFHPMARHALGYLSRTRPLRTEDHVLPTPIPGRSALRVDLGGEAGGLTALVAHLSLGPQAQRRQLSYLSKLIPTGAPAVLMGDLNCDPVLLHGHACLRACGLWIPTASPLTYPSWRPRKSLDHILVSPDIEVLKLEALPHPISDHLPLAAEISFKDAA